MQIRARIIKGRIQFGSAFAEARFMGKNEGAYLIIQVDDEPTAQMRRFMEGAIVPYYFYQNPKSGWTNFKECREALKLAHNFTFVNDREGKSQRTALSTSMTKEKFKEFLGRIERDFQENGFEFPDSEAYRAWTDSAPGVGEVYPPLEALKQRYEEARAI